MNKGKDFLEIIKMNKDLKIIKYLLLDNIQQKCLDFTKNLQINQEGYGYDDKNFPELMDSNLNNETLLKIIKKYFDYKTKENEITTIDEKLLNIIDPNIKKLLSEIE